MNAHPNGLPLEGTFHHTFSSQPHSMNTAFGRSVLMLLMVTYQKESDRSGIGCPHRMACQRLFVPLKATRVCHNRQLQTNCVSYPRRRSDVSNANGPNLWLWRMGRTGKTYLAPRWHFHRFDRSIGLRAMPQFQSSTRTICITSTFVKTRDRLQPDCSLVTRDTG